MTTRAREVLRELEAELRAHAAYDAQVASMDGLASGTCAVAAQCAIRDTECASALSALIAECETRAGYVSVPLMPTEAMWGGLARQLVFWNRFERPTGAALYEQLTRIGCEIPAWLRSEIPDIDHVPPKGTVAAVIYRAMIEARPQPPPTPELITGEVGEEKGETK